MSTTYPDKSNGWWYIDYFDGTRKRKQPLIKQQGKFPKKTPEFVKQLAAPYEEIERLAKAGITSEYANLSLKDFFALYLTYYRTVRRPNSIAALEGTSRQFTEWCETQKVTTVAQVTPQVCDAWISAKVAATCRATTVTARAFLSGAWARAVDLRTLRENPWKTAKVGGKPDEPDIKYWTEEEVDRIEDAAEGWVKDYVILARYTGLRVRALLDLTWKHVDWENMQILLPKDLNKSGKKLTVPLANPAYDMLQRRMRDAKNTEGPIFPNERTGRPMSNFAPFERIRAIVKTLGLPHAKSFNHTLRHSFAVAMINHDQAIITVSELLGHQDIRTTQVYAKVMEDKKRAAVNSLERPKPVDPGTSCA